MALHFFAGNPFSIVGVETSLHWQGKNAWFYRLKSVRRNASQARFSVWLPGKASSVFFIPLQEKEEVILSAFGFFGIVSARIQINSQLAPAPEFILPRTNVAASISKADDPRIKPNRLPAFFLNEIRPLIPAYSSKPIGFQTSLENAFENLHVELAKAHEEENLKSKSQKSN
jgi:hypothetical protein